MGQEKQLPARLSPDRERKYPNLPHAGYQITSHETWDYNCVAFAKGDETRWWQPSTEVGHFWPDYAIHGNSLDCLISVFRGQQYEICESDEVEPEYEKVALYGYENNEYSHVALQLSDGSWSSKLGNWEDIKHPTPHSLTGDFYGQVKCYMRRRKPNAAQNQTAPETAQ